MDTRTAYPSGLAHAEWAQIERVIPAPKEGGRSAKHDRREIVIGTSGAGRPTAHLTD
jgi:hypothetical protein